MKRIILGIGCFVLVWQVSASNIGFMRYSVLKEFNEADMTLFEQAYQHALNHIALGGTHTWENKETANGGEMTIMRDYKVAADSCRRLKFNNYSKQQKAVSYLNFCLIDGSWKVVQ